MLIFSLVKAVPVKRFSPVWDRQVSIQRSTRNAVVRQARPVYLDNVVPRIKKEHPVVRVDLLQNREVTAAARP